MRIHAIALLFAWFFGIADGAQAQQSSCKVCSEQQAACMKNYAGPTCKSEYKMCMKSCGKKSWSVAHNQGRTSHEKACKPTRCRGPELDFSWGQHDCR